MSKLATSLGLNKNLDYNGNPPINTFNKTKIRNKTPTTENKTELNSTQLDSTKQFARKNKET